MNENVFLILTASFIQLLGFTMAGPIMPNLARHFDVSGVYLGLFSAAYPLGMLFAMSFWPGLSDRNGRKPVLCATFTGVGIGLLAQAFVLQQTRSKVAYLLTRVASGAFSGASPVAKAYLADIGNARELPKWLAWRDAFSMGAFIIGPVAGGYLFAWTTSPALIFTLSGSASLVAAMLLKTRLTEMVSDKRIHVNADFKIADLRAIVLHVVSSLFHVGQVSFDAFFTTHVSARFALDARALGILLTSSAAISLTCSALVYARASKTFGVKKTALIGLLMVGSSLVIIGNATRFWVLILFALIYAAGMPLFTPAIPTLLLCDAPYNKRGAVMAIDSLVNTCARTVAPPLLGFLYQNNWSGGAMCFRCSGGIVLASATILFMTNKLFKKTD